MKVFVAPSRFAEAGPFIRGVLQMLHDRHTIDQVVTITSSGAVEEAIRWAADHGIEHRKFVVDRRRFRDAAVDVALSQVFNFAQPRITVAIEPRTFGACAIDASIRNGVSVLHGSLKPGSRPQWQLRRE